MIHMKAMKCPNCNGETFSLVALDSILLLLCIGCRSLYSFKEGTELPESYGSFKEITQ
jgi:hypothetical protein